MYHCCLNCVVDGLGGFGSDDCLSSACGGRLCVTPVVSCTSEFLVISVADEAGADGLSLHSSNGIPYG